MATNTYGENIHFMKTEAAEIYQDLITSLEECVDEPLYPGDERRIFGEALCAVWTNLFNAADDAGRQSLLKYARGEVLDAIGEMFGVSRLPGTKAKTMLQFRVSSPLDFNIVIPQWTKVTPDSNTYFATDEAAVLTAGSLSVDVEASAVETGSSYNGFVENTLKTLVDLIPYIATVTNTEITSGGDDGEPYTEEGDNRLRARIRLAPSAFSTAGPEEAYIYWAMTADSDIADVRAFSDVETIRRTLQFYDGRAFQAGDRLIPETLFVYSADGDLLEEGVDYDVSYIDHLLSLINLNEEEPLETVNIEIQQTLEGRVKIIPLMTGGLQPDEDTMAKILEVINEKRIRPMTDLVEVQPPQYVDFDIEICYYCTPDTESSVISTVETTGGAIDHFLEWQQSAIGRDINPDQLRRFILRPDWADGLEAAYRVDVVAPAHVTLDETQVAHWSGSLKVTHVSELGAI